MLELFHKGGPIMWPLVLTSLVALTVVIERMIFVIKDKASRRPDLVDKILAHAEDGEIETAIRAANGSTDFTVKTLVYGLKHRHQSFTSALLQAANQELKRFNNGIPVLDTIITLAPLLGLLGTVTGLIRSFGLLGANELEAPSVITGGIAEALIATAFGLSIAIIALIPFNYLNTRLEEARRRIEDASTHLELILMQPRSHENSKR